MCSTGNLLVHCYRNVKGAVVYLQTSVDMVKKNVCVLKCFLDTALQLVSFKGNAFPTETQSDGVVNVILDLYAGHNVLYMMYV